MDYQEKLIVQSRHIINPWGGKRQTTGSSDEANSSSTSNHSITTEKN
jgi:hypothetical protein